MKESQKQFIREIIMKLLSEKDYDDNKETIKLFADASKCSIKDAKQVLEEMIHRQEVEWDFGTSKLSLRSDLRVELFKEGVILGNKNGYAFCRVDGEERDYFISRDNLGGAVNRDIVRIRPISEKSDTNKREAIVEEILERGNKQVVGTYYEGDGYAIVQPDNDKFSAKVVLERGVSKISARPGDKIVVKLLSQPLFSGAFFTGEITENLGPADTIEAYVLSIVRAHDLIEEFPQEVLEFCKTLKPPTAESLKGRRDFRKLQTFTIDGKDARDLDDAVSMTKLPNGNVQLGVHIADVGEYVRKGNPIDREAFARGTSVYFPAPDNLENSKIRAVIPMIPEALSNDLCSLNPHTDKLTLSCMMEIAPDGEIIEGENTYVCESVINTCRRLNYDEVLNVLQGDESDTKRLSDVKDTLLLMGKYSKILSEKSKNEGSLDLNLPEPKFVFDENSHVVAVEERFQNEAHKLIENFMIAANRTVAKKFNTLGVPFVYRTHESPDVKKMQDMLKVIKNCCAKPFDIPKVITTTFLDDIIASSDDPIVKQAISSMVLRSMRKAVYSVNNLGHFGLGLDYYSHFTSPIRRYPDLTIHRIIKDYLHNRIDETNIDRLESFVSEAAAQSSSTEQNAEKVEREIDDLWCCEFMRDKIGKEFDVVVSDVKDFGVFVRIPNTAIEGLIKLEDMPDKNFIYNDERRLLVGSTTKFGIGDVLKVKVGSVNMFEREINFAYI